jgi:hypothetical protein
MSHDLQNIYARRDRYHMNVLILCDTMAGTVVYSLKYLLLATFDRPSDPQTVLFIILLLNNKMSALFEKSSAAVDLAGRDPGSQQSSPQNSGG